MKSVTQRIQLSQRASEPYQQLLQLHALVEKTAADAGLDQLLIELVKIRGSMLNGCSFCLDLHSRNARKLGETERRIYLLGAWRETSLYSEQERAALALTDAMTRLPETQDGAPAGPPGGRAAPPGDRHLPDPQRMAAQPCLPGVQGPGRARGRPVGP